MRLRTLVTPLALLGLAACSDAPPTAPADVAVDAPAVAARGGPGGGMAAGHADLLSGLPVMGTLAPEVGPEIPFSGTLDITEMGTDGAGGLTVDGILTITDGLGETVSLPLEDVPAELSRTSSTLALQQRGPAESGVCDILFLDLGPLFLDVLGLTVDLSEIVLDVDALSGQNRLLGNLLCAVTGLLDPLGGLQAILDRINGILDRVENILDGIPISMLDLLGTLSVESLTTNDAGDLMANGTLSGLTSDGTVVNQAFSTAADLTRSLSPMAVAAASPGRGANESGVCDVLYLDLGPIFLDLLGLTVDLAPIELDVDANRGPGNLLGNLLCAVTGLLDSGGPLDGLLDTLNQLLGNLLG